MRSCVRGNCVTLQRRFERWRDIESPLVAIRSKLLPAIRLRGSGPRWGEIHDGTSRQGDEGLGGKATGLQSAGVLYCRWIRYPSNNAQLQTCDEFSYTDPVDASVASHQGIRLLFEVGRA